MTDHPLRPVTDRRLGKPLPYQLANLTRAHPSARGLMIPRFNPQVLCGINPDFSGLSPTNGQIPTRYSPVRRSSAGASSPVTARLACVRPAASVQSEPGSNSPIKFKLACLPKKTEEQIQLLNQLTGIWLLRYFQCCFRSTSIVEHPHKSLAKLLKSFAF